MIKEIRIGKIVRPFKIAGEVKVQLYTDIPDERFKVGHTIVANKHDLKETLEIESFKIHQNHGILKLVGYESIDSVASLVDSILSLEIDTDKEDRIAFFDLLDCEVIEADQVIGKVIEVLDNPAHPILRVQTSTKQVLIPYVNAFIKDVDKKAKVIRIESIAGLL